jgi:hypothetical protein
MISSKAINICYYGKIKIHYHVSNIDKFNKTNERYSRVLKRALNPKEDIYTFFKTYNYDQVISEHKKFMKHMLENPYNTYISFKERLEKEGNVASFPELEGVIGYLIKTIFQNKEIIFFFTKN